MDRSRTMAQLLQHPPRDTRINRLSGEALLLAKKNQTQAPFEIVERVGPMAYWLKLPQELSCFHDTFHVLNLKKGLAEPDVQVPLDEIEIDENLRFVEDPIEILERDVKKLK
ncbi:hypothetical protein Tco_0005363 [Tanacetum coccineum]